MGISTAIATFFLIWWIVLFAVLPWGVRPQGDESPPGTDPGAPRVPRLRAKLIWTTGIAIVVWGLCAWVYVEGLVTLDGISALFGFPQQNLDH
jgi:predicted secreted protein